MIYRSVGDGWLMISQPAHAWLAGELAASWGNEGFMAPVPRPAVVLATRLHDIGWLVLDGSPRLGEAGQPVNFLDTSISDTVSIWRAAVTHVFPIDPFAALLVSMHAVTVYRQRLNRGKDSMADRPVVEAELERLAGEQEGLRARLARHLDYSHVLAPGFTERAYRWLRICDLLSLALCSDIMPTAGKIETVPWSTQERLTSLDYQIPKPFELILDPFPFPERSLDLTIQVRVLDRISYPSQAAFQVALENAQWMTRSVSIYAG